MTSLCLTCTGFFYFANSLVEEISAWSDALNIYAKNHSKILRINMRIFLNSTKVLKKIMLFNLKQLNNFFYIIIIKTEKSRNKTVASYNR